MEKKYIIILIILGIVSVNYAQTTINEFQGRTSAEIIFKPIKKLSLSFSPELRFDEDFSIDNYHFQLQADYKFSKVFKAGVRYRFVVNPRDVKDTEYASRYGVFLKFKKEFNDFSPFLRLSYTNDADEDFKTERSNYLRYKIGVQYDIPKCKITPAIGLEAFQELSGDGLYKMRYFAGADYKINKKNSIGLDYKFDYYRTSYYNKHIVNLTYKFKF
ncbi:DUF2490 domain-containing protein [Lentimicrobium sp. L6]|uniref:DUF2490 domain-containing protein n=1 Tax=Lentimicrobium sp. L6 TaxID=2735916 RepID=UPI0015554856|nr:DUF2490 domain-containing protein [Lentimicrobium sp. L6]NPD83936.1 DUF2490 domain-containing protein [Lentimicrobium sp. L6]